MKKAIIIGATSGIGQEVAKCLLLDGWQIGVAGRRQSALENLQRAAPDQIQIQALDVTQEDASEKLNLLIDKLGGMDLFLLSSGIGFQNMDLNMEVELNTAHTNVAGFIRMVDTAFTYFKKNGGGHLAVISSIAGTKGLGVAPAYSATKRFQNTYIDALEQLSYLQKLHIRFTDIRPGFVDTAMAKGEGLFWVTPVDKAVKQIKRAISKKKKIAFISRRWRYVAGLFRLIPSALYCRM
mgnify:CR=1 FL=1